MGCQLLASAARWARDRRLFAPVLMRDYFNLMMIPQWFDTLLGVCLNPRRAARCQKARAWGRGPRRGDFRYDPTSDVYHCPGGKRLRTSGTVHEGKTLLYRASKLDCDVCPLKPQYCPKEPSRKIPRDIHEHARDVARSFAGTKGSRRERKKIDMRFAHLKLGRLRLRGPRGAQDEFVLAASAQNLRRLATLVARPPPTQVLCIA